MEAELGCFLTGSVHVVECVLEARIAALERVLVQPGERVQDLTRALDAQQAEAARLQGEVRHQGGGRGNGGANRRGVDARMLGRPDEFHGEEARSADWLTDAAGFSDLQLAIRMPVAEAAPRDDGLPLIPFGWSNRCGSKQPVAACSCC